MAPEKLEILISADNKKAIAAIKETILSLDGVEKASKGAGGATQKMGKDFTGLSRVIQDLPYGFNAIANNLTNILPAAGALGLGISALVAGLQFAQIGFGNWTRGLGESSKATEEANKLTNSYVENLAKERSELDTLYQTAVNLNVPMEARNASVEKLQKLYPAILSNIDAEAIKAGLAADAYMRIVDAIDKKSMAAAAEDLKVDKYKELFKIQEEIKKINDKYGITSTKVIKDNNKGYQELTTSAGGTADAIDLVASSSDKANLKNQQYRSEVKELQKQAFLTQQAIDQLNGVIVENQTVTTDGGGGDKGKPKVQSLKEENAELERQIQAYKNLKFAMMGQGTIMPEKEKGKDLTNLKLTTQGNSALNQVMLQRNQIEEQRVANLELANNLTNTAMNSLNGLANAMMNGQNIGQALGDMFKRLAIDIALAAAKAAIFQAILSAVSGGAAGGGKGGFLKGFGKLLGFSEGGTVSGPKSGYPVMLHGTEHIVRPDQMRSIIASASQMGGGNSRVVVEGVVRGNDIWLSQSRTNTFRALTT
jgi:hypothetical protein